MKPIFKLRKDTLSEIRADMARPHAYAFERIGCLFTVIVNERSDQPVILATRYAPVAEDAYVRDKSIGARISSAAIRGMMQQVLDSRHGAFLVHLHDHSGYPSLSGTDQKELLPLVPSLRNAEPNAAHGALLLSRDRIAGWALLPGRNRLTSIARIAVVGFPMSIFLRRYERSARK